MRYAFVFTVLGLICGLAIADGPSSQPATKPAATMPLAKVLQALPKDLKPEHKQSKILAEKQTEWYQKNHSGRTVTFSGTASTVKKFRGEFYVVVALENSTVFAPKDDIYLSGKIADDALDAFSRVKSGDPIRVTATLKSVKISSPSPEQFEISVGSIDMRLAK